MKTFKKIGAVIFVLLLLVAIGNQNNKNKKVQKPAQTETTEQTANTNTANNSVVTIMPLGASRVQGNRPQFESYRYELWKLLVENEKQFDYVGTRSDNASYPSYRGMDFDRDHEGRGGWTSGQILKNLPAWLRQTGAPDIVLFSTPGGNDAIQNLPYEKAIANINAIIDTLQEANPNIVILMEEMAPGHSIIVPDLMQNYFDRLREDTRTIAAQKSTTNSPVILVDMYSGFSDDFFADPVHYNEAGAAFIAERYYQTLIKFLK